MFLAHIRAEYLNRRFSAVSGHARRAAGYALLSVLSVLAVEVLQIGIAGTASANTPSCEGKLGVSRTIEVSKRNGLLVGVDPGGRIGLKPKELVLTFDDGPRPGITEPILEALADECVKATFFSLGRSAREAPALLRRTAQEGHTIATHSQNHPLLTKLDDASVRAEIRRGVNSINAALEGSGYEASNFFRYPFLDRSSRTDKIVRDMNLVAFQMNIDSWDWRNQTPEEMVALTMERVRKQGSGVVLFHDIQQKTAIALPQFLQLAKAEGYNIVHVVPGDGDSNYPGEPSEKIPVASLRQQLPAETQAQVRPVPPRPQEKPFVDTQLATLADNTAGLHGASGTQQSVAGPALAEPPREKKRFGFFRRLFSRN